MNQTICILQDKFIGTFRTTYGHNLWSQEYPPCVRKALSGTFLTNKFHEKHISVV